MSISQVEVSVKTEDQVLTSTLLEYYKIRRLEIRYKTKDGTWEPLEDNHGFDVRKTFTVEITAPGDVADEYSPVTNDIYLHLTADNINQGDVKYNYIKGYRTISEYNPLEDEYVDQEYPALIIEVTPDLYVNENTITPLGIYSAEGVLIKEITVVIQAPQILDAFIFPKDTPDTKLINEVSINESSVYCLAFIANFNAADLYMETLESNKGLFKYSLVLSDVVVEGYQVYQLVPSAKLLSGQTGNYVMDSPVVVDEAYYEHSLSQWITTINVTDDAYLGYRVSQSYPAGNFNTLMVNGAPASLYIDPATSGSFTKDDVINVEVTVADSNVVNPDEIEVSRTVNIEEGQPLSEIILKPPTKAALVKDTVINVKLTSENIDNFEKTYQFKLAPNITWDMRWEDKDYSDEFEVFRPSTKNHTDLLFKFTNWDFDLVPNPTIQLGLLTTNSSTSLDGEDPTDSIILTTTDVTDNGETYIRNSLALGYTPIGFVYKDGTQDKIGKYYLGEFFAKIKVDGLEYVGRLPKKLVIADEIKLDTIKVNDVPITSSYKIKYKDQLSFDMPDSVVINDSAVPLNLKVFMTVEHLQSDGTYTPPQIITDDLDINAPNNRPLLNSWQSTQPSEASKSNPITYRTAPYGSLRWYNYNDFSKVRLSVYMLPLASYGSNNYTRLFNGLDLSVDKLNTFAKVIYQNTFDYQDVKTPPIVAVDTAKNAGELLTENGITDASKPISTNIRVRGDVGDDITIVASEVLNSDMLSFKDDIEAKERLVTSIENNTYSGLSFTPTTVTISSGNLDKYGIVNLNDIPVNVSPVSKTHFKNHNIFDDLDKPLRSDISFHARAVRGDVVIWSEKAPVNSNRIDIKNRNAILVGKVDSTSTMGLQVGVKFYSTGVYKFKIHRVVALEWLDYDIDAILRQYGNPQFTFGETVLETDSDGYVVLFKPDTLSAFNAGDGHKLNFRFGLEIEPVDDTQDYTNVPDKTQLTRVICGDVPDLTYPEGLFTNYVPLPEALNNIVIKSNSDEINLSGLEDTLKDGFTPYLATTSTGTQGVGNLSSTCNYYLLISTNSGTKVDDIIQIDFGDVESSLGTGYQTSLINSTILPKVVNGISGWRVICLEGVKVSSTSAGKPLMHVFNKRTGALLKTMMTPLYKDPRLAPVMLNGDAIQAGLVTTGDTDVTYLKDLAKNGKYYRHHHIPATPSSQLTSFYNETNQTVTVNLLVHSSKLLTDRFATITSVSDPAISHQSPIIFEQLPNNFILGKAVFNIPDSEIASDVSNIYNLRINEVTTVDGYPELSVEYNLNVLRPRSSDLTLWVRSSNMSNFTQLPLKLDLTGPTPRFIIEGKIPVGFLYQNNSPWGTNCHYIEYKFINSSLEKDFINGFVPDYSTIEPPIISPLLLTDQWTGNAKSLISETEESSLKVYGVLNGNTRDIPPICLKDIPSMTISPTLGDMEPGNAIYLSVKQNVNGIWKIPAKDELFTLTNVTLNDHKLYEFKIALLLRQNTAAQIAPYIQVINQRTGTPLDFYADAEGTSPLYVNQISNDPANPTSIWVSLPASLCTYDVVSIKVWDDNSPAEACFNIVIQNLLRAVV